MRHVHAQILLRIAIDVAPHRVEQLMVRERAPRIRREHAQQMPLHRRQTELPATSRRNATGEIERQVTDPNRIGRIRLIQL